MTADLEGARAFAGVEQEFAHAVAGIGDGDDAERGPLVVLAHGRAPIAMGRMR